MRTLLSLNNYHYARGGAEIVYLEHNRLLAADGWQVIPFSMQHEKNIASSWDGYFPSEIEFGSDYSISEKMAMAPKVIYSFEASKQLESLIIETQPSVAHAHNIYHHLSPAVLRTLKKHKIPTVLTLHDLKIACPAYKMLNRNGICEACKGGRVENVLIKRCVKDSTVVSAVVWLEARLHGFLKTYQNNVDKFVVPSKFYIDKFVEWGWDRNRFEYIANFIDPGEFVPQYETGQYFLYFGRVSEEKGLETLIRASAQANLPLVIVGTGPEQDRLKALAEQLEAKVVFAGYQTGEALHHYISRSKALVLPSEWYENAPISVMEAYALGKPVIGANIGGIPELIKPETGSTFESGSINELAETLHLYDLKAPSHLAEMGRAGREWVERDFTSQRYVSDIERLYGTLA